jgi:uncharacterized protein YjeT (DUF2065 family)
MLSKALLSKGPLKQSKILILAGMLAAIHCTETRGEVLIDPSAGTSRSTEIAFHLEGKICGVCYATWQKPTSFLTEASDAQLRRFKRVGLNSVSVRVAWSQEGYNSTEIAPNFATPTDESIAHVVRFSRDLGMKTMIALMVDFTDDNLGGTWRWWGQIAPGEGEKNTDGTPLDPAEGWKRWFASYEKFLLHYAHIAEASKADMLCIGNEFVSASTHEAEWRGLIAKVRKIYKGKLTYQAHGGTPGYEGEYKQIRFWGLLDYIAMNGYWKLTDALNPSSAELETALQQQRDEIRAWYAKLPIAQRKPILFSEVGYHSADGTASHPWERNALATVANPALQARCFEAFLKTFEPEPWNAGVFWWVQSPPGETGIDTNGAGHPFLGKPAAAVLSRYARPTVNAASGGSRTGGSKGKRSTQPSVAKP